MCHLQAFFPSHQEDSEDLCQGQFAQAWLPEGEEAGSGEGVAEEVPGEIPKELFLRGLRQDTRLERGQSGVPGPMAGQEAS